MEMKANLGSFRCDNLNKAERILPVASICIVCLTVGILTLSPERDGNKHAYPPLLGQCRAS
jgi:hypothetical protein